MSFLSNFIARAKGESLTLGIDVGHFSIKTVLVHHRLKSKKIIALSEQRIPEGSFSNGEMNNQIQMRSLLQSAVDLIPGHYLDKDIAVSIPWANGVLADVISIKKKDNTADEQLILFEAGSRPPFDDQNITLDYKILSRDEQRNEIKVLLVAAKNQTLSGVADFFHSCNLKPFSLDVDVFALLNSTSRVMNLRNTQPDVRAVLMVGEEKGHISFVKNGSYHSTREITSASVSYLLKLVSHAVKVPFVDLRDILFDESQIESQEEIQLALNEAIDDLTSAVSSSISYYQSSEPGSLVNEIVLAGGGALLPGLDQQLADALNLTVSFLDSFEGMKIKASLLDDSTGIQASDRIRYAVALGLAMRLP